MDEVDFLRGIEGEQQNGSDLVSGAEHLVRLKIQSGQQTQPKYEDLELEKKAFFGRNNGWMKQQNAWADDMNQPGNIERANNLMIEYARKNYPHADKVNPLSNLHPTEWELAYSHAMADPHFRAMHDKHYGIKKEAKIFGRSAPHTLEHAAIPEKTRAKQYKEYVNEKATEEPTGYLKGIGGGGLIGGGIGGGLGALLAAAHGRPVAQMAGTGALVGGGLGGLVGGLSAKHDKKNITTARDVVKNKDYETGLANHIADTIDAHRSQEWWDDERRHHQILRKLADVSESIGSAAMCKTCGMIKCACTHSKTKAAEALKSALREKLAAPAPQDWNKSMLAATTGLGAFVGGIGTYLSSRAQKDTGKSKMEEDLGAAVEANKNKPERGFLHKLKNREVESAHGLARVFREHPVKASLLGTLTGAAGGYGLGQLGGAIARRGGK